MFHLGRSPVHARTRELANNMLGDTRKMKQLILTSILSLCLV